MDNVSIGRICVSALSSFTLLCMSQTFVALLAQFC